MDFLNSLISISSNDTNGRSILLRHTIISCPFPKWIFHGLCNISVTRQSVFLLNPRCFFGGDWIQFLEWELFNTVQGLVLSYVIGIVLRGTSNNKKIGLEPTEVRGNYLTSKYVLKCKWTRASSEYLIQHLLLIVVRAPKKMVSKKRSVPCRHREQPKKKRSQALHFEPLFTAKGT